MIKELDLTHNYNKLNNYIDIFPKAKVLVIGDIIFDEYLWGNVTRISPEAPVPVVDVKQETKLLGGAANVVNNIRSLGGKTGLCGVIGDDHLGREILAMLDSLGVIDNGIIEEPDRTTSIKTRIVAHNQQVVRFDRETRMEISMQSTQRLLSFVQQRIDTLNAVIVADYGKGVITEHLMKGLCDILKDTDIILAVDPKTDNFRYYQGIHVITPNHHEAGMFSHLEITNEETLVKAGRYMLNELHCQSVLITQGKDGMTLFERNGEMCHIPTISQKVFDVTGAGDTVISTLCLGLASGMDLKSAAVIANYAAGIVVGEVGTSVVTADELKKVIKNHRR